MLEFTLVSALIQGLVQIFRKRNLPIDGFWVNVMAGALGLIVAYLLPETRIVETLYGAVVNPWLDIVVSGLSMGVGASVIRELIKAVATDIQVGPPPPPDEQIP